MDSDHLVRSWRSRGKTRPSAVAASMLVIDHQPTVRGRFTDGSRLGGELLGFASTPEKVEESEEEQATDVDCEMTLVPGRRVYDGKTGTKIPGERK